MRSLAAKTAFGGVGFATALFLGTKKTKQRSDQQRKNSEFPSQSVQNAPGWLVPKLMSLKAEDLFDFMDAESKTPPNDKSRRLQAEERLKNAISRARNLCWGKIYEDGIPGLVICVSVNGRVVWKHGFGYADVENKVLACAATNMRIASISKSITMAVFAKLWEDGKIDLDKPIREYVPSWPEDKANITARQLVSHTAGIRHYGRKGEDDDDDDKEFEHKEYYSKKLYKDIESAIEMFKNDELMFEPGTDFLYTTHGYTLVSAIIESVSGEPFTTVMKKAFHQMGLQHTYLDEDEPIIYHRSRYYVRDKKHKLKNAPFVDNSYKWAGGGFVSNVADLVQFGNAMLYSYQHEETKAKEDNKSNGNKAVKDSKNDDNKAVVKDVVFSADPLSRLNQNVDEKTKKASFLKSSTMKMLWSPVVNMKGKIDTDLAYGMGWMVVPKVNNFAFGKQREFVASHTGGAVGASSVLLIQPSEKKAKAPQGVVVAVICNMQEMGLRSLAQEVAKEFQDIKLEDGFRVQKVYEV